VTRVYRPSSPRWRWVAGAALAGAVIGLLGSGGRTPVQLGTTVGICALVVTLIAIALIALARSARLEIDGTRVTHRHPGGTETVEVGPGWRFIEYRRNVGRQARWLWALFDERDRARIILDGARWSRTDLADAFAATPVVLATAADAPASDDLDQIFKAQIEAFTAESSAPLAAAGLDPTVPPMPTGVERV
jgi:hypothetical protein